MKKEYILLAGILILFIITRLYKISEIPSSVYWDEASIGYNAYSVLLTGEDEWGDFLPLHLRAFSEFKLPTYIYSVVAAEKLFGLSALAVRFPAVIFSLLSILLVYLLAVRIFQNKLVAIFGAFFLSISPYLFLFSRTGYEATAGMMFFLLGLYLYLLSKTRKIFLILATISFIAGIYSYNGYRILVPLTAAFLLIDILRQYGKNLAKIIPVIVASALLFSLSLIPIWKLMTGNDGANRYQAIALYSTGNNQLDLIAAFAKNYLSHFSPGFLFISGDSNLRSHMAGMGELYWLDLPLIILGLVFIWKKKKKEYMLVLFVLLISPIVAALTKESPHALRTLTAAPFWAMLSAVGLGFLAERVKSKIIVVGVAAVFLIMFALHFKTLISEYPTRASSSWQYAYSQIFTRYSGEFSKFDKVIVSEHEAQPYIFGLFYLKYDPEKFRSEVKYNSPDRWGMSTVESFSNFSFRKIKWDELPEGRLLVFASHEERSDNILEKEVVKNLDGKAEFYVYEIQR